MSSVLTGQREPDRAVDGQENGLALWEYVALACIRPRVPFPPQTNE